MDTLLLTFPEGDLAQKGRDFSVLYHNLYRVFCIRYENNRDSG